MKRWLAVMVGAALTGSVEAQLFTPESFSGAALGGIIGGVVGHNNHGRTAEGIAIGAGAGYVLGELAHYHRQRQATAYYGSSYPYNPYPYYASSYPVYGYRTGYPASSYDPYSSGFRPNYALTGAAAGGIAGAVIGNQYHGQSGEGAAIGAAAGLVLGSLAERHARQREKERAVAIAAAQTQAGAQIRVASALPANRASQLQASPSLIRRPGRRPPASSMSGANRLFGR